MRQHAFAMTTDGTTGILPAAAVVRVAPTGAFVLDGSLRLRCP